MHKIDLFVVQSETRLKLSMPAITALVNEHSAQSCSMGLFTGNLQGEVHMHLAYEDEMQVVSMQGMRCCVQDSQHLSMWLLVSQPVKGSPGLPCCGKQCRSSTAAGESLQLCTSTSTENHSITERIRLEGPQRSHSSNPLPWAGIPSAG